MLNAIYVAFGILLFYLLLTLGLTYLVQQIPRNPEKVKLLFLEGCYADTKKALLSLYRWVNPFFGIVFGPMIVFWMNLFYKNALDKVSPARLAPLIKIPVLLIHGETDHRLPLSFAKRLRDSFSPGCPDMFVGPGAGHSGSSRSAGYKSAVKAFLDRNLSIG